MEHKIILKCRICLGDFEEEKMFHLFKEYNNIHRRTKTSDSDLDEEYETYNNIDYNDYNTKSTLSQKVEMCCGVQIRESVELPTKICIKCFDLTRMWFNFRQMCVNSQVYLESLCKDRPKPSEFEEDDSAYLHFLLYDLQSVHSKIGNFRFMKSTGKNIVSPDDDSENDDIQSDVEQIEENFPSEDILPPELLNMEEIKPAVIDTTIKDEPIINSEIQEIKTQRISLKKNLNKNKRKRRKRKDPETSYMCSICGNVYNKKTTFAYHMNLHSNIKPHECEICGKNFRQVCELKNHMRRHTGEKPFKCSYCDRHFIDRSEKHRHERVHTNTRPYSCNICEKSFMYSAILKNHMKLHSGEKKFTCLICQKSFTLQHQLKAHLQTLTHKQKEDQFVSSGYEVLYE